MASPSGVSAEGTPDPDYAPVSRRFVAFLIDSALIALRTPIRRVPKEVVLLSLILLVALAARTAWVLWVDEEPTLSNGDARVYHSLAKQFAAGCGYCELDGTPAVLFPPGYPFLLGALYWLFGSHAAVGQIANVLLTTLNVGLVFFVAKRVADGNTALVAAGLYAILPSNAMFSTLLMSEPLFTTMLLLILLLTLRCTSPIIVGALIGLSVLVPRAWSRTAAASRGVRCSSIGLAGIVLAIRTADDSGMRPSVSTVDSAKLLTF